ncbi:pilus assembly protein PilZ [Methylobacterium sp. ID0610]|uniref:pilus assembly protein PilZ n=1 Tax=Methylobacterium carpenticola TaxID=3344827 RepID=UPI0036A25EE3
MTSDRRTTYRMDAFKLGLIRPADGEPIDCLVWNRTALGLMLEVEPEAEVPPLFRIVVESLRIDRGCRIRWRQGRKLGVSYVD